MAFDAFIKIDDIEGESTDEKHPGWIEVLDCGVGIKQKISRTASSAGGASAERADFHDFNVTKQIDKSSPELALACANGTHKQIDKSSPELALACANGTHIDNIIILPSRNG
jgi:type VI secretion system secreted protein Hcp